MMAITTKHQLLAWDLVEALNDQAHKGVYFRLAKIYDEAFLRKILSYVKETRAQGKIKKEDCGRYFMGILKKELQNVGGSVPIKKNDKNIKNNTRKRSGFKKKNRVGRRSKKS
ncbi:MAG: hypothetical protein Q8P06_02565 [Candidatus Azambacteria bacterium]|nr:hypothetical protein [Candidatus Azambacteria bacterium]